jgi:hypothetical protein
MSLYKEMLPPMKDLKNCPHCENKIIRDIFMMNSEDGRKMIEADACNHCEIIYYILPE